jgi:tetratricopeptide (TPR) repeat protein
MRFILILIFLGIVSLVEGQSYVEQIIQGYQYYAKGSFREAEQVFNQILQKNPPEWVKNAVFIEKMFMYLQQNKTDEALNAFSQGISYGFNDYLFLHEKPEFRVLFQNKRFQQLYQSMRISPADHAELLWLKAEFQQVNHETTMMITENMGRPDEDYTSVPLAAIPTRVPQSSTILVQRELLNYVQLQQKNTVLQSDISRKMHNTNMNIIGNIPSGTDSTQDYWAQQEKLRKIQESSLQANQRAERRRQAIVERRFILAGGTSTIPQACPPLGSIDLSQNPNTTTSSSEPSESSSPSETYPENHSVEEAFHQGAQALGALCGRWEGTGKNREGSFRCQILASAVLENSYLQMDCTLEWQSGSKVGKVEKGLGMVTYDPQTSQYVWYYFYALGGIVHLVGTVSPDGKTFQFQLANGGGAYCQWKVSERYFDAVVEMLDEQGKAQWFSEEHYQRK